MRKFATFTDSTGGLVQIVATVDGERCFVGYLPGASAENPSPEWLHWGAGEGGFAATVGRFEECRTWTRSR
jgi:hypothetical protein